MSDNVLLQEDWVTESVYILKSSLLLYQGDDKGKQKKDMRNGFKLYIAPSLFQGGRKLCVHSLFLLLTWWLDEPKNYIHLYTLWSLLCFTSTDANHESWKFKFFPSSTDISNINCLQPKRWLYYVAEIHEPALTMHPLNQFN